MSEVLITAEEYGRAPRIALELERAFCAREACGRIDPTAAALGADGRLLLVTPGRPIVQLDSTGALMGVLGGVGGGPGEYRSVMALGFSSSGAVQLFDVWGARRISYTVEGVFDTSAFVRPMNDLEAASFAGERLYAFVVPLGAKVGELVSGEVREIAEDGRYLPTPIRYPVRASRATGSDLAPVPRVHAARPLWATGPTGIVHFTQGDELDVLTLDSMGRGLRRVHGPIRGRIVTSSEVERALERRLRGVDNARMREAIRGSATGGAAAEELRHPMITALVADEDGTLYLREAEVQDQARWIVVSPAGHLAGYVLLPDESRILLAKSGRLLISKKSDAETEPLGWYRLGGPG